MELIEICGYVKDGCETCPYETECLYNYHLFKTKEEWKKELDKMITNLIGIRQRLDMEGD